MGFRKPVKSPNKSIQQTARSAAFFSASSLAPRLMQVVPGGFAARNRGADYVEYLAPSLRAGTRYSTRLRAPGVNRPPACSHPTCSRVSTAIIRKVIDT